MHIAKGLGWEYKSLHEIATDSSVTRLRVVASRHAPSAWARIAPGSGRRSSRVALARTCGPHALLLVGPLGGAAISRQRPPRRESPFASPDPRFGACIDRSVLPRR